MKISEKFAAILILCLYNEYFRQTMFFTIKYVDHQLNCKTCNKTNSINNKLQSKVSHIASIKNTVQFAAYAAYCTRTQHILCIRQKNKHECNLHVMYPTHNI